MAKVSRYHATGFYPLGEPPARRKRIAATVEIARGDILHDNTAGYATNATTTFDASCYGVAAAALDNSPAVSGAEVEYYPLDTETQYIVAVGDNLIATTDVSLVVNLNSTCNTINGTAITEGIGFFIDEIDVSADAIIANTYGFAIGHFVVKGTQA